MAPLLSVIIPARNEGARLPNTLPTVLDFLDHQDYGSEVLVVDSASTDDTGRIVEHHAQHRQDLQLLRADLPGKGRAVRLGMLAAKGEYRFICDADLSMPIEQVNRFVPPRLDPEVDIAIASREAEGAIRYDEPVYRHVVGRAFNILVRLLAIPGIQDTQCGFKSFRAEVAEDLFHQQTLDGWTFDVELLFIAQRRGYTIKEIPIPWYYNPGSRVSVLRDSFAMFSDLFRIRYNEWQGRYDG
ncbi:MAG: glycosyltransferase family 2 protein [Anaerolineales bacterium]|nr:glycosyltransferase family 2 protein [Anaerolineales bacterium]